jgi:hypothetical protein
MRITAQLAFWMSLVFAAICIGVGVHGLTELSSISDEAARSDARGFAWFWLFLGAIAVASAVLCWLIAKGKLGSTE